MSVDFGTHEVVWHKPPVVAPLVCDKTGTKLLSDSIWRNQAGRYHTEFPVLKDKVFNKIDNVLNYLKANGIEDSADI